MTYIEQLRSPNGRIRDRGVDTILEEREHLARDLMRLIDPDNAREYRTETRCVAAYLLGELRVAEAAPVLARALADEMGPSIRTDISRYDAPVGDALVKIGRPAVPAMIENIESSDNLMLRFHSLDVLNQVLGGKRRLLELLAKLRTRATRDAVILHLDDATVRVRQHYRESKEPLY